MNRIWIQADASDIVERNSCRLQGYRDDRNQCLLAVAAIETISMCNRSDDTFSPYSPAADCEPTAEHLQIR